MKKLIVIISLILILTGLTSIIANIQWQPVFIIKEVVKEREIVPEIKVKEVKVKEVTVKEVEKKVRVGETYSDLDKNLLRYCIEAGKTQMLQEKGYNWSYWSDMEKKLEQTEKKLLRDNILFYE